MLEFHQEHLLANQLRACGHFLYYQTGGKSGQQRILVRLLKTQNLTQKTLQGVLDISSGALSEILQKMEDAALIERKKCKDDKRQVALALTPSGKAMALEVEAHYLRTLEQMFSCLDDREKTQLSETLGKLAKHLETIKAVPVIVPTECKEGAT